MKQRTGGKGSGERGNAPQAGMPFIINEAEERRKGQWGERKRAAGRHAQLIKKLKPLKLPDPA
jgi:hypothetical protein